MSKFIAITDVWEYLNNIPMFSKSGPKAGNFGLDNISLFCEQIGNPQKDFKSIHVAGTNGKGTTCYLLEAVYKEAGYKTGMFTSPHLLKYNERVRISGSEAPDSLILEFFQYVEPILEEVPLTYFEISTALAFWAFSKEKVDVAIIEAGLGGRLDSTNIINPELSIITSIGKDHEKILGDTLEEITFEKAGIIKANKPVVIGNLSESSLKVIEKQAELRRSKLIKASGLDPGFEPGSIYLNSINTSFNTLFMEPVNSWNLATVYQTVNSLQWVFPVEKSAFKVAIESFKGVPGRFEKLHMQKNWYFSGSHNEQAINAMLEALKSIPASRKVLILSMMKDKVKKQILDKFKSFDKVYYYEQEGDRAASVSDISRYIEVEKIDETNAKIILNELNTELVIFAGSFYFYPTIKRWLTN